MQMAKSKSRRKMLFLLMGINVRMSNVTAVALVLLNDDEIYFILRREATRK
jgi:hypothetical protein